jgi:hypothetical protein
VRNDERSDRERHRRALWFRDFPVFRRIVLHFENAFLFFRIALKPL